MRYLHVLSRVTGSLWLITEDALANLSAVLEARINYPEARVRLGAGASYDDDKDDAPPQRLRGARPTDAVIPVSGFLGKRLSMMEAMCGATDVDWIWQAFDDAQANPAVQRIVLHIDSPGGTVTGIPELAARMADEKRKPLIAVSDTLIASAAYWLASAADEIRITPTTEVGSIGVVMQVRDGVEPGPAGASRTRLRVFRSGAHKAMGLDVPLTEAQAAHLQAQVDSIGAEFRGFVSAARGPRVPASAMEGLTYRGLQAQDLGLVDAVYPSLAAALA